MFFLKQLPISKIPHPIKLVCSRAVIFYVIVIAVAGSLTNFQLVGGGLKARQLNFIRPAYFDHLVNVVEKGEPFNRDLWSRYTQFFEKVVEYIDGRADAYGMLGYCYYYVNDMGKSVEAYHQAVKLKPRVFSYHYNLGKVYYRLGKLDEARGSFEKALASNLNESLEYILSSKMIYLPILKDTQIYSDELTRRLYDDYRDCTKLLMMVLFQQKKYQEMLAVGQSSIEKKVFTKDIFYSAGLAALELKEYALSEKLLNEAIRLDRLYLQAYEALGRVLNGLGENERAVESIQRAVLLKNSGIKSEQRFYLRFY